jgi:hypothetical protein
MGYVSDTCCLPVEVFEGAGGDLVILQEFPGIQGETFVRVFISMDDAERLCADIMRVARSAKPQ